MFPELHKINKFTSKFIYCLKTHSGYIYIYGGRRDKAKSILNLRTTWKQTVGFILHLLSVQTAHSTNGARGYVACTVSLGMKAKTKIRTYDQTFGHYQLSQAKYPYLEVPPPSAKL